MGKKVKKKARSGHKDKKVANSSSKDAIESPKSVLPQICTNSESPNDEVVVLIEKRACPHIDKGVNLENVSEKLNSSEPLRCEDCREGMVDKRAGKGRKKKGGGGGSKTIWVCLQCGHFSCGGAGLPSTPQSHAVRHARQYRHPLVVKFDKPHLRWCFPCNTIIQDPLHEVVKLIKGRSPIPAVDVEDIWFGTGSVLTASVSNNEKNSGYMARGLMNLGNTCFFNSVMQNLLAMDMLRDYFFKFEGTIGPLTTSLKKLFTETTPESGFKNIINPKSFFGCVCAKAPQFRGYQQHDSHELLRCLLDAWCTEESNAIKQKKSQAEADPTFVDAIFGGQLSSTISCLECTHSSTVYEPFLDLSLPVPTKKPSSRKAQPVYRGSKLKPPPKRRARIRSKVGNNSNDCASLEMSKTISVNDEKSCDPQNNLIDQNSLSEPGKEEASEILMPSNDTTWLDFLSTDTFLNDEDSALDTCSSSVDHVINKEDAAPSDMHESIGAMHESISCNDLTWLDFCEPGKVLDGDDMASLVNVEPATQNEVPLQVQDSEIILLPYGDDAEGEASSLVVGCDDQDLEFNGFGGLFDEPEADVVQAGGIVGQSSESDDEVDNSDAPVSVERCLSFFIKPEVLSKDEHAWKCENCSNVYREQKMKIKKVPIPESDSLINGTENLCNGIVKEDIPDGDVAGRCEREYSDYNPSESSNSNGFSSTQTEPQNVRESTSFDVSSRLERNEDEETLRDATKTILINRAPPILTIHLKRFSQDERGRLSKLKGHIDFRDSIDIRPYIDPRCNEKDGYTYRLLGVVEHSGSMRGGHYVAYVRGGKKSSENASGVFKWYYASDAYVHEVKLEEVLRCEAYILFYEKV